APKVWAAVDLRFAAFRGGAFASIQFQKPSLSFQREGRSSRAVRIAGSFAFDISGKCTVMNSSGSPSVFSISGKVGLSDRLSASFSHRLLNMNAELAHINHSVLGANQAIPQHEQTRRLRRGPPTEDDVRNAIERATVSATRIEIVLSESIVAEEQDRVLTLPWTRTSSRRRREIIQRVGEAQQPLRAMRTKARDGFIKALRDAHRW